MAVVNHLEDLTITAYYPLHINKLQHSIWQTATAPFGYQQDLLENFNRKTIFRCRICKTLRVYGRLYAQKKRHRQDRQGIDECISGQNFTASKTKVSYCMHQDKGHIKRVKAVVLA